MTVNSCRQAIEHDVDDLFEMIDYYAKQGIMLPRSKEVLHKQIDSFVVMEIDGEFAGGGSLLQLGKDLIEIRSLGVSQNFQGKGVGRKLVEHLVEQCRQLQIPKVMALTYEVDFFKRLGFVVVDKEIFPEKVWRDCIYCSKQHACDEIAVLKRLD